MISEVQLKQLTSLRTAPFIVKNPLVKDDLIKRMKLNSNKIHFVLKPQVVFRKLLSNRKA